MTSSSLQPLIAPSKLFLNILNFDSIKIILKKISVPFPEELQIHAGSSRLDFDGEFRLVHGIHRSPHFDPETVDYDVAVLEVGNPLVFNENVAPITMADAGTDPAAGAEVVVTGWGYLSEDATELSNQLQEVTVNIVDRAECNAAYGGMVTDRMICAGVPEGGKDACVGDSGSPLVEGDRFVGIVSWGSGCGRPGFPGVYTRIGEVRDFISAITGI